MNLTAWMKDIDDNRDLFSLNSVGTHDCATKFVRLSRMARCQDKNICDQLEMGVRCLDARVKSVDGRLKMVHGICDIFVNKSHFSQKMDMSDILEACYKFLDRNPSEAIILQFKNDSNKEMENCFDILYNSYIKPDKDKWFLENRSPLMNEARGKITLLRRCNAYNDREYPLGMGIDFSKWAEQDEVTPTPFTLKTGENSDISFVIQDRFKYKPYEKWLLCVKPFLDSTLSDDVYIINYLSTAGGLKGPKRNADYINAEFMKYELENGKYYGIIYTDFPDSELIERVVETNKFV